MEHFVPFEEVGMSGESNRYNDLSASQKLEVDHLINRIASKDKFLVNGSLESVLPDEEMCEAFVRFGLGVLDELIRLNPSWPIEGHNGNPYAKYFTEKLEKHAGNSGLRFAYDRIEQLRENLNNPQNDELGVCEFHADGRRRCGSVVEHILRAYTQGQQTLLDEPVYADAD
jgi:hypothetical protein